MSKENDLSMLDPKQIIQEIHNETEKAVDVIRANNLVPKRFGKVELEYITSGNGMGEVGAAKYYSDGQYQQQSIIMAGDVLGTAHKTTVNFYTRTPTALSNTYFTIYEATGPVTIWFDLNGAGTVPDVDNRKIRVIIASSDTEQNLAEKLNSAINADSSFFSVVNDVMVMIVNLVVGTRQNSVDVNSGLVLKNLQGTNKSRLGGTTFLINSENNTDLYYAWYNVDGLSDDPMIPSRIGIEIPINSGASANEVAVATANSLAAQLSILTNISDSKLTITNKLIGASDPIKNINCNFISVVTDVLGASRALVAHLILTYDISGDLSSVERL